MLKLNTDTVFPLSWINWWFRCSIVKPNNNLHFFVFSFFFPLPFFCFFVPYLNVGNCTDLQSTCRDYASTKYALTSCICWQNAKTGSSVNKPDYHEEPTRHLKQARGGSFFYFHLYSLHIVMTVQEQHKQVESNRTPQWTSCTSCKSYVMI